MEPMSTSRKYSQELRQRAVRMVFAVREETGDRRGGVARVAGQLGINKETLRNWVNQAEVDDGRRPGVTTHDQRRIAELEREVRELRRANEILKAASAFFARELCATRRRECRGRVGDPVRLVVAAAG
jgi:transposase